MKGLSSLRLNAFRRYIRYDCSKQVTAINKSSTSIGRASDYRVGSGKGHHMDSTTHSAFVAARPSSLLA